MEMVTVFAMNNSVAQNIVVSEGVSDLLKEVQLDKIRMANALSEFIKLTGISVENWGDHLRFVPSFVTCREGGDTCSHVRIGLVIDNGHPEYPLIVEAFKGWLATNSGSNVESNFDFWTWTVSAMAFELNRPVIKTAVPIWIHRPTENESARELQISVRQFDFILNEEYEQSLFKMIEFTQD